MVSTRTLSASEVARNARKFDTWAVHQGCEQVSYADLPSELRSDVDQVFCVAGQIPTGWIGKGSALGRDLSRFLKQAHVADPSLFSASLDTEQCDDLLLDLTAVFLAWRKLLHMRESRRNWSEADLAGNVYQVLRSPAIRNSTLRLQCAISLPAPFLSPKGDAKRVMSASTVIPDCVTFIDDRDLLKLASRQRSPFQVLNRHPKVLASTTNLGNQSSTFRGQGTPCSQVPEKPSFEFASSFWEDKKPSHESAQHAYRQNRMSTAAAVRQLYAFGIRAPVFGLVWADGIVKAHVDWASEESDHPRVRSAPYSGPVPLDDPDTSLVSGSSSAFHDFHEWDLASPAHIIQVYLLIRNIDRWTSSQFKKLVTSGITDLAQAVTKGKKDFKPWKKRVSAISSSSCSREGRAPLKEKENNIEGVKVRKKPVK